MSHLWIAFEQLNVYLLSLGGRWRDFKRSGWGSIVSDSKYIKWTCTEHRWNHQHLLRQEPKRFREQHNGDSFEKIVQISKGTWTGFHLLRSKRARLGVVLIWSETERFVREAVRCCCLHLMDITWYNFFSPQENVSPLFMVDSQDQNFTLTSKLL
jgi:hypothetical protein